MMSGHTDFPPNMEQELAAFVNKEVCLFIELWLSRKWFCLLIALVFSKDDYYRI